MTARTPRWRAASARPRCSPSTLSVVERPSESVAFGATTATAAPPRRVVTAVPASGPIRVDGLLVEPSWQTGGFEGFTQSDPQDGGPATEKTTVWIAFDRNNLYLAARCRDAEPGRIVRLLGRRDDEVPSDWFYLGVDPYYDRRTGYTSFRHTLGPGAWTLFRLERMATAQDGGG